MKIKVSQESSKNSKSPFASALLQSSLLKPLFNVNGRTNEYCVYSNTPILLYLEPERTHDMSGFPRMNLQYVLERKTPQHLKNELESKGKIKKVFSFTPPLFYLVKNKICRLTDCAYT